MSGLEAVTIIGLISSVITIIETSWDLYDATTSANGLHEAFRSVSQNIPLVLDILRDCKKIQEQADRDYESSIDPAYKHELENSAKSVECIMSACKENAQKLKKIFEKVIPGDQATWLDRYWKAAKTVMSDKKRKVEDLMKEILQKLQLLQTNQVFKSKTEKRSGDLNAAIQQLSAVSPSLPRDDSRYSHSGSGPLNVNANTGTQRNYSQTGGSNNKQFNAETQTFHGDYI